MKLVAAMLGIAAALSGDQRSSPSFPPPTDVAHAPEGAQELLPGLFTVERGAGSGAPAKRGDCVVYRFVAWKRDGTLYSSSGRGNETAMLCLAASGPGLGALLQAMKTGESRRAWMGASLVARSPTASKKDDDDTRPAVDLTFDLTVVEILRAPSAPDDLRRPTAGAKRLPEGVFLEMLKREAGSARAAKTSEVQVHSSCWNPAGDLLETTKMSGHPRSLKVSMAPMGWREGLVRIGVGEKGRLWIPAALVTEKPEGDQVCDLEVVGIR